MTSDSRSQVEEARRLLFSRARFADLGRESDTKGFTRLVNDLESAIRDEEAGHHDAEIGPLVDPDGQLDRLTDRAEAVEQRVRELEARIVDLTAVLTGAWRAMNHMGDDLNAFEAGPSDEDREWIDEVFTRVRAVLSSSPTPAEEK